MNLIFYSLTFHFTSLRLNFVHIRMIAYLILPIAIVAYWYLSQPSLTLYWAKWCPHCKTVLPAFQTLSIPGVNIRTVEQSLNFEYKVSGFPCVVYRDGMGASEVYSGPRTPDGWASFVASKK